MMRKVLYITGFQAYINEDGTAQRKEREGNKYLEKTVKPQAGWFHGFFQEGNEGEGLDLVAVIEMGNGKVCTVGVGQIKFL